MNINKMLFDLRGKASLIIRYSLFITKPPSGFPKSLRGFV